MKSKGYARPSFFWYDNHEDLKGCFLVTRINCRDMLDWWIRILWLGVIPVEGWQKPSLGTVQNLWLGGSGGFRGGGATNFRTEKVGWCILSFGVECTIFFHFYPAPLTMAIWFAPYLPGSARDSWPVLTVKDWWPCTSSSLQYETCHGKTDLKIFVLVIPKGGLAGPQPPTCTQ